MKKNIVIFDLDGTLANIDHRKHYIECSREKQDWNAFYDACHDDKPIDSIIQFLVMITALENFYDVYIFTGRSEAVRGKTVRWIQQQDGVFFPDPENFLFMRPEGDFTSDHELKRKWAEKLCIDRIWCVFEDRASVVEMWRSLGITCLQVAPGDF